MISERVLRELRAVGAQPQGIENGVPYGNWEPDNAAVIAVTAAHEPDDEGYRTLDLDTHAAALKALVNQTKWNNYCKVQTSLIKKLRWDAYLAEDGPSRDLLVQFALGKTHAQAVAAVQAAVAAIDAIYYYPGSY